MPKFIYVLMVPLLFTCKSHSKNSNLSSTSSKNAASISLTQVDTIDLSYKRQSLTVPEYRGLQIWYRATAGTETFHTGPYIQRLGVLPNWNDIVGSFRNDIAKSGPTNGKRETRFDKWGLINDPDCRPPLPDDDFFGWPVCPGDEKLSRHVGSATDGLGDTWFKSDPACDLDDEQPKNAELKVKGLEDWSREDSCYLRFGTSAGVVGLRKFPNPKFNKQKWINAGGWSGYYRFDDKGNPDGIDNSLQPPFLVGTTCAFCHVSFDPINGPEDQGSKYKVNANASMQNIQINRNNPQWDHIDFLVGSQHARMSEAQGAHLRRDSIEWQGIAPARPGTVDTSAVSNDFVFNPGTPNPIMNLTMRPEILPPILRAGSEKLHPGFSTTMESGTQVLIDPEKVPESDFKANVERWRRSISDCSQNKNCQKIVHTTGTTAFWEKSIKQEYVPHILKGGEDDVGADLAVQRVYINIGSCSEQCWMNNLLDVKEFFGRNATQAPFNTAQCRRDCPSFRSIEDRVFDIYQFLISGQEKKLKDAVAKSGSGQEKEKALFAKATEGSRQKFPVELSSLQDKDIIDSGRKIFNRECASCHSTQGKHVADSAGINYRDNPDRKYLEDIEDKVHKRTIKRDWLGNDRRIPNDRPNLQINECRSLHSNHMEGHIWSELSSLTYKQQTEVKGNPPIKGFEDQEYNTPLKNEDRGQGRGFFRNVSLLSAWAFAPFLHNNAVGPEICNQIDKDGIEHYRQGEKVDVACMKAPVTINERLNFFDLSMRELLSSNEERNLKVRKTTQKILLPVSFLGITPTLPEGITVGYLGNLDFRSIFGEFVTDAPEYGDGRLLYYAGFSKLIASSVFNSVSATESILRPHVNCSDMIENRGHTFGSELSQVDKEKLISFLKTL